MSLAAPFATLAALLPLAAADAPPPVEPAVVRLTLDQAVAAARDRSSRLAGLDALVEGAEAGLRAARAGRAPVIEGIAGYTRQSDVPELTIELPGRGPRTLFPNLPDNYRSRLDLALPVYTGGRTEAAIEAAGEARAGAEEDLRRARIDLELETRTAFWSLVTARARARVLGQALAAYQAHLAQARDRRELGLAPASEVLAVEVEYHRAELGRLVADSAAEVLAATLAGLLALPPGVRFEPAETLAAASPEEEPAAAPGSELEALVAEALAARPERRALAAQARAREALTRAERAGSLPRASFVAGYDYANPNRRILPPQASWRGTWDVGASVAMQIFDGGRTDAQVARAAAAAAAARAELEELDRRIRVEVTSRRLELDAARPAVAVAARAVAAAVEARRVAADRYREGVSTSADLLDAENALLLAGLEEIEARAGLRIARARLDRALGR